ncbi:hypothetical protein ACFS7Z_21935 [Pontibacter toksunensis]|uniref:Uncharacterized protein n=2 Tax=Pontibacter toksunensis TaxID=1332631 RepID=A0ABW6C1G4_9BACT
MFLATRRKEDFIFSLYYMRTFFAEVWYLPGEDRLGMVRGFKSVKQLDPFLDDINLEELLK